MCLAYIRLFQTVAVDAAEGLSKNRIEEAKPCNGVGRLDTPAGT